MKVKRIMANTATSDLDKADRFYGDILGLERLMDHGWFRTYGSHETMMVQVSFGSEGGSGTLVPDLSIEVDDLDFDGIPDDFSLTEDAFADVCRADPKRTARWFETLELALVEERSCLAELCLCCGM